MSPEPDAPRPLAPDELGFERIVYIIWGSTYLFIAIAVDTIPPLAAVSTRFIAAGLILAAIVVRRGGTMRVSGRELVSCVLIGCLLPGANAVLFFAEQPDAEGARPRDADLVDAEQPEAVDDRAHHELSRDQDPDRRRRADARLREGDREHDRQPHHAAQPHPGRRAERVD